MARSWMMASAISSVQRIPERSIRSLMRFLEALPPRPNRPAVGKIVVVLHPGPAAVEVIGNRFQNLAFGTG